MLAIRRIAGIAGADEAAASEPEESWGSSKADSPVSMIQSTSIDVEPRAEKGSRTRDHENADQTLVTPCHDCADMRAARVLAQFDLPFRKKVLAMLTSPFEALD